MSDIRCYIMNTVLALYIHHAFNIIIILILKSENGYIIINKKSFVRNFWGEAFFVWLELINWLLIEEELDNIFL